MSTGPFKPPRPSNTTQPSTQQWGGYKYQSQCDFVIIDITSNDNTSLTDFGCIVLSPQLYEKNSMSFNFSHHLNNMGMTFEANSSSIYNALNNNIWISSNAYAQQIIENEFKKCGKDLPQLASFINASTDILQHYPSFNILPISSKAKNSRFGCNQIYETLQRIALYNLLKETQQNPSSPQIQQNNDYNVWVPPPSNQQNTVPSNQQNDSLNDYQSKLYNPVPQQINNNNTDYNPTDNSDQQTEAVDAPIANIADEQNDNKFIEQVNNRQLVDANDNEHEQQQTYQQQPNGYNHSHDNDQRDTMSPEPDNINNNELQQEEPEEQQELDENQDPDELDKLTNDQIELDVVPTQTVQSNDDIIQSQSPPNNNTTTQADPNQNQSQSQSYSTSHKYDQIQSTSPQSKSSPIATKPSKKLNWASLAKKKNANKASPKKTLGVVHNVSAKWSGSGPTKSQSGIRQLIDDAIKNKKNIWVSYDGHQRPFIPREIKPVNWGKNGTFYAIQHRSKSGNQQRFYLKYVIEVSPHHWKLPSKEYQIRMKQHQQRVQSNNNQYFNQQNNQNNNQQSNNNNNNNESNQNNQANDNNQYQSNKRRNNRNTSYTNSNKDI